MADAVAQLNNTCLNVESMANDLLQEFLDAGLFNFGDDDQRLKDFQAAAKDIAEGFAKSPAKVIPAVLVAIDPAVPDQDPVLDEVEAAVKKHWNSFRNKFPERPTAFLRPILWQALQQASAAGPEIASAIWLTGASVFPHLAAPKERGILEEFLLSQGRAMETAAEETWALARTGEEFAVPPLALKFPKTKTLAMDAAGLEEGLAAASAPHNQQNNKRYANGNPYFTNQAGNWSWEFAPRAAATICKEVDRALAPLANQASSAVEQIEPQLKEFGKKISLAINHWVNASVKVLAQRSALMWWKEALYSPSMRKGYREMSPVEIAVAMALDLHELAPAPSPQSVEYFLREAIRAVVPAGRKISISELLGEVNRSKILDDLLRANDLPGMPLRVPLLTAVHFARQAKIEDISLPAWLGFNGDLKQPLAELAVWLFRDAQARSLTLRSQEK